MPLTLNHELRHVYVFVVFINCRVHTSCVHRYGICLKTHSFGIQYPQTRTVCTSRPGDCSELLVVAIFPAPAKTFQPFVPHIWDPTVWLHIIGLLGAPQTGAPQCSPAKMYMLHVTCAYTRRVPNTYLGLEGGGGGRI